MDVLKTTVDTQRRYMEQIKTVMTVQRDLINRTFEQRESGLTLTPPPINLIHTYSDILKRQDEWDQGEIQLHECDKEYAYKLFRLRQLHNRILELIEETREDSVTYDIPFDFTISYQAVQNTSI